MQDNYKPDKGQRTGIKTIILVVARQMNAAVHVNIQEYKKLCAFLLHAFISEKTQEKHDFGNKIQDCIRFI